MSYIPNTVTGPASATGNAIALFNGTTGKILEDSAVLLSVIPKTVASVFNTPETGSDANVLTHTLSGPAVLQVQVSVDTSAISAGTLDVTVSWNDSNTTAETQSIPTITATGSANLVMFISAEGLSSVVISTVFAGTSIAYNISSTIIQY